MQHHTCGIPSPPPRISIAIHPPASVCHLSDPLHIVSMSVVMTVAHLRVQSVVGLAAHAMSEVIVSEIGDGCVES